MRRLSMSARGEEIRRSKEQPEEVHATTAGAAGAGAVTGAAIGTAAAGPIGTIIGGLGGAVAGMGAERLMHGCEEHQHVEGDEAHFVGDHEHTGDDCEHDHRFHYDFSVPYAPLRVDDRETRDTSADEDCDDRSRPGVNPLLIVPPGDA
jgi:hypothetical protein